MKQFWQNVRNQVSVSVLLLLAAFLLPPASVGFAQCNSCGGKDQSCGDKQTKVKFAHSAYGFGDARYIVYYEDDRDNPLFEQQISLTKAKPEFAGTGEFCADNGRRIIAEVFVTSDPGIENPGSLYAHADITFTEGCSNSVLAEPKAFAAYYGEQHTGADTAEFFAGTGAPKDADSAFGDDESANGSVHQVWRLGRALDSGILDSMALLLTSLDATSYTRAALRLPLPRWVINISCGLTVQGPDGPVVASRADLKIRSNAKPDESNMAQIVESYLDWWGPLYAPGFGFEPWYDTASFGNPRVDIIRDAGSLPVQIRTGSGLVNLVTQTNGYRMEFYKDAQVAGFDDNTGRYSIVAGSTPFVTYYVENPDYGQADATGKQVYRRIKVTKKAAGEPDDIKEWRQENGGWTFASGNGQRVEAKTITSLIVGGDQHRVVTVRIEDGQGQLISKSVEEFDSLGRHVRSERGEGVDVEWTTWQFNSNNEKPDSMQRSDGYYERYINGDDATATYTDKIIKPWGDLPFANANPSNGHVFEILHEKVPEGDKETTTEKITGIVVSKVERITSITFGSIGSFPYQPIEVTTTKRYAGLSTTPLVSKMQRFPIGASQKLAGRTIDELHEDGRQDIYSYRAGYFDPSSRTFFPNAAGPVLEVTVTRNPTDIGAVVGVSTQELTLFGEDGQTLLVEQLVCSSAFSLPDGGSSTGTFTSLVRTAHHYQAGHLILSERQENGANWRAIYQAGYTGKRKEWEIDETGVTTVFSDYDGLGLARRIQRESVANGPGGYTVPGNDAHYVYDAEGRTISEAIVSGSTTLRAKTWKYNTARQLVMEATAYESGKVLTTRTVFENGGRRTKVIMPGDTDAQPGRVTENYLDGRVKAISGTRVVAESHSFDTNADGTVSETVTLGAGEETSWTRTKTDGLERVIAEEKPSSGSAITSRTYFYNSQGRLWQEKVNDSLVRQLDYPSPGAIQQTLYADPAPQRVTTTTVRFEQGSGAAWYSVTSLSGGRTEKTKVGGFEPNELSDVIITDGAKETRTITTVDIGAKTTTRTTTKSGASNSAKEVLCNGLTVMTTSHGEQLPVYYSFDALGRVENIEDTARKIMQSITYEGTFGRKDVVTVTGTAALVAAPPLVIDYDYYGELSATPGELRSRTVEGRTTYHAYDLMGRMTHTWGAAYPARSEYDAAGRLSKMHTYRTDPGTDPASWAGAASDVTTWVYYPQTTLLKTKLDASNRGPVYNYDATGRLETRKWVRTVGGLPVTTSYSFNRLGEPLAVSYNDGTPGVTWSNPSVAEDGSLTVTVTDVSGTRVLMTSASGRLVKDTVTSTIGGQTWTSTTTWDTLGRKQKAELSGQQSGVPYLHSNSWLYDPASGRVQQAWAGAGWATYGYGAGSWLESTTYAGTDRPISLVRTPDQRYRLRKIETRVDDPLAAPSDVFWKAYTFDYDSYGQRRRATLADGSYWEYGYNGRGEVTSGRKYTVSGTVPATVLDGSSFSYGYDAIGNRDAESGYSANQLNQYDSRAVPGRVNVFGVALADAAVTVKVGSVTAPARREGEYYSASVPVDNQSGPVWKPVSVSAVRGDASGDLLQSLSASSVYVPPAQESFGYDEDGNLKSDSRFDYEWDAENRLSAVTTRALPGTPELPRIRLTFAYDAQGRRVEKALYRWNAQTGSFGAVAEKRSRFFYDGWNLLEELEGAPDAAQPGSWLWLRGNRYYWGVDLSGSLIGAGGVGGLMGVAMGEAVYVPGYDGNGNVVALVRATGNPDAQEYGAVYEYGPFGEPVRRTGGIANGNPFRFSTKYQDSETGLLYYGYRYYNPTIGRWMSRDPIQERGGNNLFRFVRNGGVARRDYLGLIDDFWMNDSSEAIYPPPPPLSHDSERAESRPWVFSEHSVVVQCYTGDASDVKRVAFDLLKTFAKFNSSTARVELRDGIAYFDLLGWKGFGSDLFNDDRVAVFLTADDDAEVLTGKTAGAHQLIGVRKWSVSVSPGPPVSATIKTSAYELPRGLLNEVGMNSAGRTAQMSIWKEYLERVGAEVARTFNGKRGEVQMSGPTPMSPGPNPYR